MTTPTQPLPSPNIQPNPTPPGGIRSAWNSGVLRAGSTSVPVNVPKPLPRILGARPIIFYSWLGAIILVAFDDWHNLDIIPRPSRMWYTSLTYGLLCFLAIPDALVPLANALAIGFTIMLLWQYYNSSGQFTSSPVTPTTGS
jgi:hypothetical protein